MCATEALKSVLLRPLSSQSCNMMWSELYVSMYACMFVCMYVYISYVCV